MSQYRLLDKIGSGAYGTAYLVFSEKDKQFYCQKIILLEGMDENDKTKSKQEIEVLKKLNHENIVALHDSLITEKYISVIMEYCGNGDLEGVIKKATKDQHLLEESIVLHFFVPIVHGLSHVHELRILHRDLKPSNIFLTEDGVSKIGDFGISRVLIRSASLATTTLGTPYYLSPEVCSSKAYDHKSDIWSLGCILYELCSLKHVFEGNNLMALVLKIMNNDLPAIPNNYDAGLQTLFKKMLAKEPQQRPDTLEILKFDICKDYYKKKKSIGPLIKQFLPESRFDLTQILNAPVKPEFRDNNSIYEQPNLFKSPTDGKHETHATLSESKLYGTGVPNDNKNNTNRYDKFLESTNLSSSQLNNNDDFFQSNVYHNKLNESKLQPVESKLSPPSGNQPPPANPNPTPSHAPSDPQDKPASKPSERPIKSKGFYEIPPDEGDPLSESRVRCDPNAPVRMEGRKPVRSKENREEFSDDFEEIPQEVIQSTLNKYKLTPPSQPKNDAIKIKDNNNLGQSNAQINSTMKKNNINNNVTIRDDRPIRPGTSSSSTLKIPRAEIVPSRYSSDNLKHNIINEIGQDKFNTVLEYYQSHMGSTINKAELLSKFPSIDENILRNIEYISVFNDMN